LVEKVGHPRHRAQAGGVIDGGDVAPIVEDCCVGDGFGIVKISKAYLPDSRSGGKSLCDGS